MTPFRSDRYSQSAEGGEISQQARKMDEIRELARSDGVANVSAAPAEASRFERLVQAVESLIARHRALREENAALRQDLADRDAKLRVLNQRRQDALKRIDDLVDHIERLDARFAEARDAGDGA